MTADTIRAVEQRILDLQVQYAMFFAINETRRERRMAEVVDDPLLEYEQRIDEFEANVEKHFAGLEGGK